MRAHWPVLPVLIPALAVAFVGAIPSSSSSQLAPHEPFPAIHPQILVLPRETDDDEPHEHAHEHHHDHDSMTPEPKLDPHEHAHGNHHAQPLLELNETDVLLFHAPTPESYWTIDMDNVDPTQKRYPAFMALHILFMSLAFFGALPIGIALRSVKHSWHGVSVIFFYAFVAIGLASSWIYKKLTPNMYEGQKHSIQGYLILFFANLLSAVDLIALVGRLVSYIKSARSGQDAFSIKSAWRIVVLGREDDVHLSAAHASEYTNLVAADPEEYDAAELKAREIEGDFDAERDVTQPIHMRRAQFVQPIDTIASHHHDRHEETVQWANNVNHRDSSDGSDDVHYGTPQSAASDRTLFGPRSPRGSVHSDETLHETVWTHVAKKTSLLKRVGHGAFATAERALVFAGFMQVLTGIVVYTGGCRGSYINGCLAHLIKGGIFWCYGLVTFARFLGSFSELGWAWNRAPAKQYPSAEFVECFVIFLYGASNTWMERFGAAPGSPFTTKQMQHISIAVMFWFAGLIGMGIESKRIRRWLAASATAAVTPASASPSTKSRHEEAIAEPPSYRASFNPFPALCIGITGAAMSAHFQTYLFQVQIHALWGFLLTGFAVLRCLTYFFLWVSPPRSILPSRPPTEALAAFFLACGGLVFMFSTEELTFAAMRRGHDDMMMALNVAVALTCLACCWCLGVVAFRGWLKSRMIGRKAVVSA